MAATFWTLNSLNKTYYNVRVSYPVEFVYDPEQLIPLTEPPKELVINVTGKGWKLLRKALNLRIRPARIELPNRLSRNFLTSRQLRPYVNASLSNLVLNYIVTDTIYFNFEPLVKKQLNLSLDTLRPFLAPGYKIDSAITLNPEKVVVSGPASLVNALPDPYPVHIPDSLLTENFNKVVPLAFIPEELVRSKTRQVKVAFNVRPIPFRETEVAVNFLNGNPEADPAPRARVKVRYQSSAPLQAPLPADSFEIVADLTKVNLQDSTVELKLRKKPAVVKSVSVAPQKVKVRITNPE